MASALPSAEQLHVRVTVVNKLFIWSFAVPEQLPAVDAVKKGTPSGLQVRGRARTLLVPKKQTPKQRFNASMFTTAARTPLVTNTHTCYIYRLSHTHTHTLSHTSTNRDAIVSEGIQASGEQKHATLTFDP